MTTEDRIMDSSREVGEVRRVHVVYFLCRNGKIEQPHLIRVHHLHRNGVHLRDVKRWLSELRGRDMPETFAWSYKRRYKAGYVWQDLIDDDLITPISDNEYVLKGSELSCKDKSPNSDTTTTKLDSSTIEAVVEDENEDEDQEEKEATEFDMKSPPETLQIENVSPKPPPRLDEESPGAAARQSGPLESSGSSNQAAVFKIDLWKQHKEESEEVVDKESGNLDSGAKSRRSGRRTSNMLRNLLGCKPMEPNDSVQAPIQRLARDQLACREISDKSWPRRRTFDGGSSTHRGNHNSNNTGRKSQSTNGRKNSTKKGGEGSISAVYKPVGGPNCSQCGKTFKPEKLHSHMKSCKGLRGAWKV